MTFNLYFYMHSQIKSVQLLKEEGRREGAYEFSIQKSIFKLNWVGKFFFGVLCVLIGRNDSNRYRLSKTLRLKDVYNRFKGMLWKMIWLKSTVSVAETWGEFHVQWIMKQIISFFYSVRHRSLYRYGTKTQNHKLL